MRKVLYLSLKEFRSAQKRQLEDGTPNSNGNLVHTFPGTVELVLVPMTFVCLAFYFWQQFLPPAQSPPPPLVFVSFTHQIQEQAEATVFTWLISCGLVETLV